MLPATCANPMAFASELPFYCYVLLPCRRETAGWDMGHEPAKIEKFSKQAQRNSIEEVKILCA